MALSTPFPDFKTTGDDKHDIEVYIEDPTDYCTMKNWFRYVEGDRDCKMDET